MKYTGKVYKIYEREFRGKMSYSIKLDDQPLYHRLNDKRFAGIAESGNVIEFEAEPNADGKSTAVKGEVRLAAASSSQPQAATSFAGGGTRDASIQYQSSRKDALEFLSIAITAGAIKLPAKEAAKLKAMEALVDYYTAGFYEDIGTLGAVSRSNGSGEGEEDVAGVEEDEE